MKKPAEQLAQADRAFIIAPAGYGKTHTIAEAIGYCEDGRQLILTHTHAGVRSIREKLKNLSVSPKRYEVDTIAGWSLKLASAFPLMSGLIEFNPVDSGWNSVYSAATRLMGYKSFRKILQSSYRGVFVDEYQDCTIRQHNLILVLAECLPCRVLGDPLQGILTYDKNEPLVNWVTDVATSFSRMENLYTPWRWINNNSKGLGDVLRISRDCLENSQPLRLNQEPITWAINTRPNQIYFCKTLLGKKTESVVAIHAMEGQCIYMAKMLQGKYSVMEALSCSDLFKYTDEIYLNNRFHRTLSVVNFASKCMTNITTTLALPIKKWSKDELVLINDKTKNRELVEALNLVAIDNNLSAVTKALPLFRTIDKSYLYRKELWYEMKRALRIYLRGGFETLQDAAWHSRNITREHGRYAEFHVVSRTSLIKGLEFDHALVLDADALKKKEDLYVAMTRGSKSLTVLSSQPVIRF